MLVPNPSAALAWFLAFSNSLLGFENDVKTSAAGLCPTHSYEVKIFAFDPLILYLVDFISESEARHLLNVSADLFSESQRVDLVNGVAGGVDKSFRSSQTAFLKPDQVTTCIEERALALQSHIRDAKVEGLQVVKYGQNDFVHNHYDWFTEEKVEALDRPGRRDSTIFGYIHANCTGGGTNFPRLSKDLIPSQDWCRYIECGDDAPEGITFKAISHNAVFWQNFDKDEKPRRDVLHSGQPVRSGSKVGLNLWTSKARTLGAI